MPGAARGEQVDSNLRKVQKSRWRSDESSEEVSVDSELTSEESFQENSKYETVKFKSTVGMLKTKRTKRYTDEATLQKKKTKRKRKLVLKKKLEAEGEEKDKKAVSKSHRNFKKQTQLGVAPR